MPYTIKMSWGVVYHKSQFKMFLILMLQKKLAKENTVFNFIVYFIQVTALIFSLKQHKNKLQEMVKNLVKLIQYFIFFSDVTCLLTFFF